MNRIERLRVACDRAPWFRALLFQAPEFEVALTANDLRSLLDLVEAQHEAVGQLGNHYCGTHDEDAPYHDVDPDDVMNTCEGCQHTVRVYRAALAAYEKFDGGSDE